MLNLVGDGYFCCSALLSALRYWLFRLPQMRLRKHLWSSTDRTRGKVRVNRALSFSFSLPDQEPGQAFAPVPLRLWRRWRDGLHRRDFLRQASLAVRDRTDRSALMRVGQSPPVSSS